MGRMYRFSIHSILQTHSEKLFGFPENAVSVHVSTLFQVCITGIVYRLNSPDPIGHFVNLIIPTAYTPLFQAEIRSAPEYSNPANPDFVFLQSKSYKIGSLSHLFYDQSPF